VALDVLGIATAADGDAGARQRLGPRAIGAGGVTTGARNRRSRRPTPTLEWHTTRTSRIGCKRRIGRCASCARSCA